MSAERVATVTQLSSRAVADSEVQPQTTPPALPALPAIPVRQVAAKVADVIVPPDIWSDDRPGLRKLWLYGRWGQWTRADGPLRFFGTAYAVVAGIATAVLYTLAWIIERPSRFAVAAVLGTLVYLTLS